MASASAPRAAPPAHAGTKLVALPIEAEGIPAASAHKVIFTAAAPTIEGQKYKTVVWYANKQNPFQAIAFDGHFGNQDHDWYAALRQCSEKRSKESINLQHDHFLNDQFIVGNVHAEFDPLFVATVVEASSGNFQSNDTWAGDTNTLQHCAQLLCNVLLRLNHHVASVWIKSRDHLNHRLTVTGTPTHTDGTAMPWATEVVKTGENREVFFLNHKLVSVIYNSISANQQMQAPTIHGGANAKHCRHHGDAMANPDRYLNFDLFTYVNWKPAGGGEGPSPPRRPPSLSPRRNGGSSPASAGRHRSQPPMPAGPPPAAAGSRVLAEEAAAAAAAASWAVGAQPIPINHSQMHADGGMGFFDAPLGSADLTNANPNPVRYDLPPQDEMDNAPDGAEGGEEEDGDDGFDWAAVPTQGTMDDAPDGAEGAEEKDEKVGFVNSDDEEDEAVQLLDYNAFLLERDLEDSARRAKWDAEFADNQYAKRIVRRERIFEERNTRHPGSDDGIERKNLDPYAEMIKRSDRNEAKFYRDARLLESRTRQQPFAQERARQAAEKAATDAASMPAPPAKRPKFGAAEVAEEQLISSKKIHTLQTRINEIMDLLDAPSQINAEETKSLKREQSSIQRKIDTEKVLLVSIERTYNSFSQDLAGQAARRTPLRDEADDQ